MAAPAPDAHPGPRHAQARGAHALGVPGALELTDVPAAVALVRVGYLAGGSVLGTQEKKVATGAAASASTHPVDLPPTMDTTAR